WVLGFSRDGKHLAGTGGRVVERRTHRYLDWHHGRAFAFSPTADRLAAGHTDGKVRVFAVPDGNALQCLEGHEDNIAAVAFSPDGTRLAICGGRVSLHDPLTGKEKVRLTDGFAGTALGSGVAFAADGRHVAAANGRKVALWNIQNHRPALAFEIEAAA